MVEVTPFWLSGKQALGEQTLRADRLLHLAHSSSSRRWRATNTSVDSLKPLSVTSPIRSNSR